jgi:hypothetical protein
MIDLLITRRSKRQAVTNARPASSADPSFTWDLSVLVDAGLKSGMAVWPHEWAAQPQRPPIRAHPLLRRGSCRASARRSAVVPRPQRAGP